MSATATDAKREMLRHTLATLAYRGRKAVSNAPDGFGQFRASENSRAPVEILAHIGDLLDWALWMSKGDPKWNDSTPLAWADEVDRFFKSLQALEEYLASDSSLGFSAEKVFQGPIADALTHVGQIAILRRIFGAPIKGENYFKAEIVAGRVGREQAAPLVEFD